VKWFKPYKTNKQIATVTILCTFKIPPIVSFADPRHLTNSLHRCRSTIGNISNGVSLPYTGVYNETTWRPGADAHRQLYPALTHRGVENLASFPRSSNILSNPAVLQQQFSDNYMNILLIKWQYSARGQRQCGVLIPWQLISISNASVTRLQEPLSFVHEVVKMAFRAGMRWSQVGMYSTLWWTIPQTQTPTDVHSCA